jgi:hypothetical protein
MRLELRHGATQCCDRNRNIWLASDHYVHRFTDGRAVAGFGRIVKVLPVWLLCPRSFWESADCSWAGRYPCRNRIEPFGYTVADGVKQTRRRESRIGYIKERPAGFPDHLVDI